MTQVSVRPRDQSQDRGQNPDTAQYHVTLHGRIGRTGSVQWSRFDGEHDWETGLIEEVDSQPSEDGQRFSSCRNPGGCVGVNELCHRLFEVS